MRRDLGRAGADLVRRLAADRSCVVLGGPSDRGGIGLGRSADRVGRLLGAIDFGPAPVEFVPLLPQPRLLARVELRLFVELADTGLERVDLAAQRLSLFVRCSGAALVGLDVALGLAGALGVGRLRRAGLGDGLLGQRLVLPGLLFGGGERALEFRDARAQLGDLGGQAVVELGHRPVHDLGGLGAALEPVDLGVPALDAGAVPAHDLRREVLQLAQALALGDRGDGGAVLVVADELEVGVGRGLVGVHHEAGQRGARRRAMASASSR